MSLQREFFIKSPFPYDPAYRLRDPAPLFRRRFVMGPFRKARLSLCALGYGYAWINGRPVSDDLLAAPVSDYRKTLWYYDYDVSPLLREGENVIALILGNGFFNESLRTSWDFDRAPWRDQPKLALSLEADGKAVLTSDADFRCTMDSPVVFNQLRSGETFDARLYDERWNTLAFDDSAWPCAIRDVTPPRGVFRLCPCEPVRACRVFPAQQVIQTGDEKYVFDIGQNISGFVRLKVCQPAGDELVIRYGEQINPDGSLNLNRMEIHYKDGSPFQTDRFICDGKEHVWSPRFTYHGFRYIEVSGLKKPDPEAVSGVFAHQDVRVTSSFRCSDERVNELFRIGQMATLSNLFYMPTDCPTREKLGWANDAQASAEQMLTDFSTENLFRKWIVDIRDAMREDGMMPGIIPTGGWGYEWGNGPVSDGVLFEVPYRLYLHTGDGGPLVDCLPAFRKYLAFLDAREEADGQVDFGLDDWARPEGSQETPRRLINSAFRVKFLRIAALAASLAGEAGEAAALKAETVRRESQYKRQWLKADGTCVSDVMSAVALTISHDLYDDLRPLAGQLKRLVEERDFHHSCGMVGLRHLYRALNRCGLEEYAWRVVTAEGYPGYMDWLKGGATTLWEMWGDRDSRNHHMYSDFMSWLIKTPGGIRCAGPGFGRARIEPAFIGALSFCEASQETARGTVSVSWRRTAAGVELFFRVPAGMKAEYGGREYGAGEYRFTLNP